jgi:hypothetical protein
MPLAQLAAQAASSFQMAPTATAPPKAAQHQADSAVQITSLLNICSGEI